MTSLDMLRSHLVVRGFWALSFACSAGCSRAAGSAANPAGAARERGTSPSPRAPSWADWRHVIDSGLVAMARQPAARSLRAEPEQMKRVDALLDAFQSEMVEMNMSCDARMAALTDSVRRDADRLPGLTIARYRQALPDRADRLRRLMAAQELMMQSGM